MLWIRQLQGWIDDSPQVHPVISTLDLVDAADVVDGVEGVAILIT